MKALGTGPAGRGRAAGLTLVELLAAVAIFLGLAGMVLQVLGGGLGLWSRGERTRETSERAAVLLERLAEELRHLIAVDRGTGEPDVKLYCDFVAIDPGGEGTAEVRTQRLLFVRRAFEERRHPLLRTAGEEPAGEAGIHFEGEVLQDEGTVLLATESRTEVAFLLEPDVRPAFAGRLVLFRGYRTPIGGRGSLFESIAEPDGGLVEHLLEPMAENLLLVGFEFLDSTVTDLEADASSGGGSLTWDSTRGLLPLGDGDQAFRYARDRASLTDPDDDVFPHAIRITVVVASPPGEAPEPVLLEDLDTTSRPGRIQIGNGRSLRELPAGAREVRIGHEWVEIGATDGGSIRIVRRGLWGTATSVHPTGTRILTGRRFRRTVRIPVAREDLDALLARRAGS